MEKALQDCCRSMRIGKILVDSDTETHEARVIFAKFPHVCGFTFTNVWKNKPCRKALEMRGIRLFRHSTFRHRTFRHRNFRHNADHSLGFFATLNA